MRPGRMFAGQHLKEESDNDKALARCISEGCLGPFERFSGAFDYSCVGTYCCGLSYWERRRLLGTGMGIMLSHVSTKESGLVLRLLTSTADD